MNIRFHILAASCLLAGLLVSCSEVPGDAAFRSGHYEIARNYYETQYGLGNIAAGERLADMLIQGLGGPPNQAKALAIYSDLAMKGDVVACHNLGVCYERGKGTPINYQEAARWYRKAADAGDLWSIYNYGTLYANQHMEPSNDVLGLAYLLCATQLAKGNGPIFDFIRNDNPGHVKRMKARMTHEQLKSAETLAAELANGIQHPIISGVLNMEPAPKK
ncbi:MAG: tetratricopeptide repeat protein [Opitutales bacterium]